MEILRVSAVYCFLHSFDQLQFLLVGACQLPLKMVDNAEVGVEMTALEVSPFYEYSDGFRHATVVGCDYRLWWSLRRLQKHLDSGRNRRYCLLAKHCQPCE